MVFPVPKKMWFHGHEWIRVPKAGRRHGCTAWGPECGQETWLHIL